MTIKNPVTCLDTLTALAAIASLPVVGGKLTRVLNCPSFWGGRHYEYAAGAEVEVQGKALAREVFRLEVDCGLLRLRILSRTQYARSAEVISTKTYDANSEAEWIDAIPGSWGEATVRAICVGPTRTGGE